MKFLPALFSFLSLSVFASIAPSGLLAADERIDLTISSGTFFPGDLFEARISLADRDFKRWDLAAPRHKHLRVVSEQRFPTQADEVLGYLTSWVVVYQAIQNGEGVLSGGYLSRSVGEETFTLSLEDHDFVISTFSEIDDDEGLEPLRAQTDGTRSLGWSTYAIASFIIALLVGWFVWKKRRSLERSGLSTEPEKRERLDASIRSVLSCGELSRRQALLLLDDFGDILSKTTIECLQKVAFARVSESKPAVDALRKEALR